MSTSSFYPEMIRVIRTYGPIEHICFWIELSLAMINAARVELKNSVIACYPHCLYISHVCLNNFSSFFCGQPFHFSSISLLDEVFLYTVSPVIRYFILELNSAPRILEWIFPGNFGDGTFCCLGIHSNLPKIICYILNSHSQSWI